MIVDVHCSSALRRRLRRVSARRGSTLLLLLALVVIAIPLFVLLIDSALTTLSRRQMQTAVDSAAIEGLRLRDDESVVDEAERRDRVAQRIEQTFDDDLLATSTDAMAFGAGPNIPLIDGETLPGTDYRVFARIDVQNARSYKPTPQSNLDDLPHGDAVEGQYVSVDVEHGEASDYSRTDFATPGSALHDPSRENDAFLVRLRRTRAPDGSLPTSVDEEPGVSSTGPTVPFLFGRAPWGGVDYLNRRERGTVVRATAIAQARPAVVVGIASDEVKNGLAPYWIEREGWETLSAEVPSFVSTAGGVISGSIAGSFIEPEVATVGMTLTDSGVASASLGDCYVAIYEEIAGIPRIVGFATASLDLAGGTITKRRSAVAPSNASAQYVAPLPPLSASDASALFAAHRSFVAAENSETLLAPALVRSIR